MSKEFLWVEKYRPNKVKDCILPDTTRNVFQGFVEQGELPNLLLSGTAGVGKTTIAKAMCEEIGASYIVINGSDEGRFLDTVRNRVRQFATTVSLTSGASHKVVIIDEADNTTNDVQLSLRSAVEELREERSTHPPTPSTMLRITHHLMMPNSRSVFRNTRTKLVTQAEWRASQ